MNNPHNSSLTIQYPPPTHTILLNHSISPLPSSSPPPSSGSAFAAGKNDYGQIGLEGPENVKIFTKVSLIGASDSDGGGVKIASCGYYHTLFLTRNGLVLGTGRNDYGQLGLGHAQARVFGPHVIGYLRDKNVVSVAAGCYHSVAVTGNGMLYFFGRNNHGKTFTSILTPLSSSPSSPSRPHRHRPHPPVLFIAPITPIAPIVRPTSHR